MPPDPQCLIEFDHPHAVVRLRGPLHRGTVPAMREAVLSCVAAQPAAVLVDIGGVRVEDPTALSVLAAVARQAAAWPGVPVLLCCPSSETEAALSRSGAGRYIPVFPTMEAAMAGIEDQTAPAELSRQLLPVVGAAREARELVTEACARWELPELVGPACTIVTELVNNVVVHARTGMEVTLRLRGETLSIAVRDGSADAPRARGPVSPTAPGGRGLMMVEAVAQRWGYTPVPGGKVVWATLLTDDTLFTDDMAATG